MNTWVKVFPSIYFVLDRMVSIDVLPLNRWRWNRKDLVFNILVNGWVTLRASDWIVAVMISFNLSIPIPHILDSFMALNFGYQNEVITYFIALSLFLLSLLSGLFYFVSVSSLTCFSHADDAVVGSYFPFDVDLSENFTVICSSDSTVLNLVVYLVDL